MKPYGLAITPGTRVRISGARSFTGIVLGVGDTILTVALDAQHIIQLRRDPASTAPEQWRYGGLPVAIAVTGRLEEKRLEVEDYVDPDEGRD